jgi:hypothetical protein
VKLTFQKYLLVKLHVILIEIRIFFCQNSVNFCKACCFIAYSNVTPYLKLHVILAEIHSLCALTKVTCNFNRNKDIWLKCIMPTFIHPSKGESPFSKGESPSKRVNHPSEGWTAKKSGLKKGEWRLNHPSQGWMKKWWIE